MCTTSYIQSVYVVHILHALCKPQEGWRSSFEKSVVIKGFTFQSELLMSRQQENVWILSWEIHLRLLPGKVYLVLWYCCIQVLVSLMCIFLTKWSHPDQRLSFHFLRYFLFYLIKDVVCHRRSETDDTESRTFKVSYVRKGLMSVETLVVPVP